MQRFLKSLFGFESIPSEAKSRRSKLSSAAKRPLRVESLEERLLLDGTPGAPPLVAPPAVPPTLSPEDKAIDDLEARNKGLAKLEAFDGAGEALCEVYIEAGVAAREAIPGVGPVLKVCRYIYKAIDWLFESETPPEANLAAPVQGPGDETTGDNIESVVGSEQLAIGTLAEQAQLTDMVLCSDLETLPELSTLSPPATDTIVQRTASILLDGPPETVPIEIVALSLVSAEPIILDYPDGSTTQWSVSVGLSPEPQPQGAMTVPRTHENGGTFQSTLPVSAKFTFTELEGK